MKFLDIFSAQNDHRVISYLMGTELRLKMTFFKHFSTQNNLQAILYLMGTDIVPVVAI